MVPESLRLEGKNIQNMKGLGEIHKEKREGKEKEENRRGRGRFREDRRLLVANHQI